MHRDFLDPRPHPKANEEQHHCSAEHGEVGVKTIVAESRHSQEAPDTGGEVNTFPKGFTRIAVDVGQHASKTTQTGSDQAGGGIEVETVGDSSDCNASGGAASDVLLKIAQTLNDDEKRARNQGRIQKFAIRQKGNSQKTEPQRLGCGSISPLLRISCEIRRKVPSLFVRFSIPRLWGCIAIYIEPC